MRLPVRLWFALDVIDIDLALSLPDGVLPLGVEHPESAAARNLHDQWFLPVLRALRREEVLESVNRHDLFRLASFVSPRAPVQKVANTAISLSAAIVVDDVFDSTGVAGNDVGDFIAVMHGAAVAGMSSELVLWQQAMEHLRSQTSDGVFQRLTGFFEQWLRSLDSPSHKFDDMDSYLEYRRCNLGFDCLRGFVEYALDIDMSVVPPSPDLDAFDAACGVHMSLVNDLFSYRKEAGDADVANALNILRRGRGVSLQDAVDQVCDRIRDAERDLDRHARTLSEGDDAHARTMRLYTDTMKANVGGHFAWTMSTPRFNGKGHAWDGTLPSRMLLRPDRTLLLST